jgi:hypothetical protein
MTAILRWTTANPVRAFLAAGLVVVLLLPLAAWLPGALVVAGLLASGASVAAAAAAGAVFALVWVLAPLAGVAVAAAVATVIVLPWLLSAYSLEKSRSLPFTFQALTLGCCLLVAAIHGLLGDPVRALAPVIAKSEPLLRQWADLLASIGIKRTPEQIGAETASMSWALLGWLVLLHAFLAQCVGLWSYGRLREPGLFGREFRRLRLGRFIAWLLLAAFAASVLSYRLAGHGWQVAEDLVFVLAAAFLIQALAVVHGLRGLQVIGGTSVVLAYLALVWVPMALVGIGFADTWIRFRERFAPRQGV